MPKFLLKRWHGYHMIFAIGFSVLLLIILSFYHWAYGAIGVPVILSLIYFMIRAEQTFRKELQDYTKTLSHRIKKAGKEVLKEMPIGIILYNEEKMIEWNNPYMQAITGEDNLVGQPLTDMIPPLENMEQEKDRFEMTFQNKIFEVIHYPEERLLYFTDITEYKELLMRYEAEQVVFAIIHLDNLDEFAAGMDEQSRSLLLTDVTRSHFQLGAGT